MSPQIAASLGVFEFGQRLRAAFCRETSELPEQWTEENPSTGCCHVAAVVLQQQFAGVIMEGQAWVEEDLLADCVRHYWIVINGITIDVTRDQFPYTAVITDLRTANPPNATTRAKADLLRRLAFPEAEAA